MTTTPPPASIVRMSDWMYEDARALQAVNATLAQMDQRAAAARDVLVQVNEQYPLAQARRQELLDSITIAQEVIEDKCKAHLWDVPAAPPEPAEASPAPGQALPIEQEARGSYAADPTPTGASPAYQPEAAGQFAQVNGAAHA